VSPHDRRGEGDAWGGGQHGGRAVWSASNGSMPAGAARQCHVAGPNMGGGGRRTGGVGWHSVGRRRSNDIQTVCK
jgi:hypothetical protein